MSIPLFTLKGAGVMLVVCVVLCPLCGTWGAVIVVVEGLGVVKERARWRNRGERSIQGLGQWRQLLNEEREMPDEGEIREAMPGHP